MTTSLSDLKAQLGPLRIGLFAAAVLNCMLPLIDWIIRQVSTADIDDSLWSIFPDLVAPVMAPLLLVVIFFDYVMSRVRAADEGDEQSEQFVAIHRFELLVMGFLFLWWLPFFWSIAS
ncbi:MAG: hypothetical protein AAF353_02810 [Pseudomonadota bacterium]